jgi:hypothetical protein
LRSSISAITARRSREDRFIGGIDHLNGIFHFTHQARLLTLRIPDPTTPDWRRIP